MNNVIEIIFILVVALVKLISVIHLSFMYVNGSILKNNENCLAKYTIIDYILIINYSKFFKVYFSSHTLLSLVRNINNLHKNKFFIIINL